MSGSNIYKKMKALVDSGDVYRFEGLDDEDPFEPFEGIPFDVKNDLYVRVTKDNGVLKKGSEVVIDGYEFCFMSIKKVN